jgi:pyruvate dehydrogenase E1 component alpha subunit
MSAKASAPGAAPPLPPSALAEPATLQPWQVLAPDGTLAGGYEPSLDGEELLAAFRLMLTSRQVDERAFSLQRQGRLGTFSTVSGQEAAVVGSALALDPGRDWVVPQYRELPAMLRQGYPLVKWFLYFKGDPRGNAIPDGVNLLPFQISLAAQIPQAVGLGWGLRHQGSDGVVVTYFGDGASSEGDAHEAMNLAGVRRAPVVFLLQNNGWAISTPVRKQTAAPSFALRAPGYGFPGVLVDGNDLLAVHDATRWAVERARAGEGPTLIEARTYRLGAHNTADDPTRYVPPEELEERRALEPLARVRALLQARGLIDDAGEEALRAELAEEVNAAFAEAEALAQEGGSPAGLFDHVYDHAPQRVDDQREALCRR